MSSRGQADLEVAPPAQAGPMPVVSPQSDKQTVQASLSDVHQSHAAEEDASHRLIPQDGPGKSGRTERRICGLRPTTLWLSLALAAVVVIAVAVGAGVGATRGNSSANGSASSQSSAAPDSSSRTTTIVSSSASSSTSSTASSSSPTSTAAQNVTWQDQAITPVYNECPAANHQNYTAATSALFTKVCNVDWSQGQRGANNNGSVKDIMAIYTYSLDVCIEACATYNVKAGSNACMTVSWAFTGVPNTNLGNCWLKDREGSSTGGAMNSMSAKLLPL